MRAWSAVAVLASLYVGCGSEPKSAEVVDPGPGEVPNDDEGGTAVTSQTLATHFVLRTILDLGGRGVDVLCPEPQEISIDATTLVTRTVDGDRVHEEATLCGLELPRFTVSAHGAIGGCDETREAQLAVGFDLETVAPRSALDAAVDDAGDALPMAFVIGADLTDPFGGELPTWEHADDFRDDDVDGQPGVTFVATGLPVLDDGAQLYGALRLLVTPRGDGLADAGFSMSLVGSNAGLSGRTLAIVAPSFESGLEVEMERAVVDDETTCADLRDRAPLW